ncbi:alpha/beta fold hydrolase [Streptomyces luteogriseus]|uniref:alpha/beta fold hydrolase n=1 Tax=Streptomyces luteogriseus TaxID=68233 RepID=UPI00380CDF25
MALPPHGADDNCMSVELSDGRDDLFTNGLERVVIPGAGHFLHLEQPKTVADHILGFLNSRPPSDHPELERLTEP